MVHNTESELSTLLETHFMVNNEQFYPIEGPMPLNYKRLVQNTSVHVNKTDSGIQLIIETPNLLIRSVEESDISFYQKLWSNSEVMEKFGAGEPRHYSGSADEKVEKAQSSQPADYALWRIKDWESSWLNRRKDNIIWHGLTICNKQGKSIGHVVLGGGELAYFLMPEYWGKGITSEAACALTKIAVPYLSINHRDIQVPEQINATVRTDHPSSQKVLKYAGFVINETTKTSEKFGNTRYEVGANTVDFIADYKAQLATQLKSIYDTGHTMFEGAPGSAGFSGKQEISFDFVSI
jgi:RimJ/RimL family protein N-acetyltransferase